jgi:Tfp pilus assembly protein PilN
MARFEIDFAGSRTRSRQRSLVLLVSGLVVAVAAVWSINAVQEERASVRIQAEAVRKGPEPRSRAEVADTAMPPERLREMAQANRIADQLNLPWSGLFDAIEQSTDASVTLLALQPDPQDETVRLSGEGRSLPAVLAYLDLLQQQPALAGVRLESHETLVQDAQRPVRFVAVTRWRLRP